MTTQNTTDGGYYAIKGFAYQIDKAILELLNTDDNNANINIEQIQDIDSNSYVIQVKYKENAKLVPSQVNKPISQLIEEFKKDNKKSYILYVFFSDLNGYADKVDKDKKISKETLDELLGTQKDIFTNQEKKNFANNFYLFLSPEFQAQFNSIILKLKEAGFGDTDEETIFYYANISDYLYKKVCNNSIAQVRKRTCTQKEIFDYLKNGKKLISNSSFREYQGDQKYFNFNKKQFFSQRNIDYFERFIVVELNGDEDVAELKEILYKIKNKFYNISGDWTFKRIKSPAPYVFLKNISEEKLILLKTQILKEGMVFKDGFDFHGALFSLTSIKADSTTHNNLCLKLINNEENFQSLIGEDFKKTKEVYQFYINESIPIESDIKNISIKIKNILDIKFIL
ncbi:MAG: hypothetical protein PHH40_01110 [Candidatus Moranbacteria bacterium]|nr:hypothetical protein [Candidatus Moranbacteria bacterium]MDD3964911.1 hypothetical protein [Candidatus Moranbacteria bacterium]